MLNSEALKIVNAALAFIGESPITTSDGASATQISITHTYEEVRDAALAEHPWTFCTKTVTLNRLVEEPLGGGFSSYYQIPSDVKAVRAVKIGDVPLRWEVHGDKIACVSGAGDEVWLTYLYEAHESTYSPTFRLLLEYRMAQVLASSIAGSVEFANYFETKSEKQLVKAKTQNAQAQSAVSGVRRKFTNVRRRS